MNAKQCSEDPDEAMRFNGFLTSELLEASIDENVKKFFYSSIGSAIGVNSIPAEEMFLGSGVY